MTYEGYTKSRKCDMTRIWRDTGLTLIPCILYNIWIHNHNNTSTNYITQIRDKSLIPLERDTSITNNFYLQR